MLSAFLLCLVVSISDGDTLTVRCGQPGSYEQVKIRLSAIDAPESKQPFGNRSRQHLAEMCFQQQVKIAPINKDRYGRTVADVQCQGRDAAQAQVAAGMALFFQKFQNGELNCLNLKKEFI